MNILMCLANPFPPDIRVEKEARALAQAGHTVFVLSPYKTDRPVEEDVGYAIVLRRIPMQPFARRALRFARFCTRGMEPLWRRHIAGAVSEYDIDALHIHDLPLVNTGLAVAGRKGIPMVADLHENYPDLVRFHRGGWRAKVANTLISPDRWRRFEASWVRRADDVITVVDEIAWHLIKDCGVKESKVTVVMNTEDPDHFLSIPIKDDIIRKYEQYFVLSYIGGFGAHRGIETAIRAMPQVLAAVPAARLVLVGTGPDEAALRQQTRSLGLSHAVEFTGWQPFEAVPSFIAASKVCLIPYIDAVQTNRSAPHKLFQYMAMGKPVVVSSMESLTRIIEETCAGLVYPAGDEAALGEAVIRLARDKELAQRLGQSGETAVRTKYNWEMESKKLVELYRGLEDRIVKGNR